MSLSSENSACAGAAINELPEIVIDVKSEKEYKRGKFLGKGGCAHVYEFVDEKAKVVYAGKIVPKNLLKLVSLQQHLEEEIDIHKHLRHEHVVDFHSHFEDDTNVYIILELCSRQSLKEMQKCREKLTEAEVRYFLRQLLLACEYLVEEKVIHRDLKPENLLLTGDMKLKVADFGFATRVHNPGQLKKAICGTTNYMAPEILTKKGHSYEADVWSIGCIMYQLLVGYPPFECRTKVMTYAKIKRNEYTMPSTVSSEASALIRWILQEEPASRPSIGDIMNHVFMTRGLLPPHLPASCLAQEPNMHALGTGVDTPDRKHVSEKYEG